MGETSKANAKIVFALTLAHFTGDFYASFVNPLLPVFLEEFSHSLCKGGLFPGLYRHNRLALHRGGGDRWAPCRAPVGQVWIQTGFHTVPCSHTPHPVSPAHSPGKLGLLHGIPGWGCGDGHTAPQRSVGPGDGPQGKIHGFKPHDGFCVWRWGNDEPPNRKAGRGPFNSRCAWLSRDLLSFSFSLRKAKHVQKEFRF